MVSPTSDSLPLLLDNLFSRRHLPNFGRDGLLGWRLEMPGAHNYWTYSTLEGVFSIVERHGRGVDLFFGQSFVKHYRNPVAAAEELGNGEHPALPCAPDTGKSLRVPTGIHNWTFVRPSR